MVTNSRYALCPIKYFSITIWAHADKMRHQVVLNTLLSCKRSTKRFIKWRGRQLDSKIHSTFRRQQISNLKTYHMRTIRGKMLEELSRWHDSKPTNKQNCHPKIYPVAAWSIPLVLGGKVWWKSHCEIIYSTLFSASKHYDTRLAFPKTRNR